MTAILYLLLTDYSWPYRASAELMVVPEKQGGDQTQQTSRLMQSLVMVAQSDGVLRAAIRDVGFDRVVDRSKLLEKNLIDQFLGARAQDAGAAAARQLNGGPQGEAANETGRRPDDSAAPAVEVSEDALLARASLLIKQSLVVRAEQNSDIIRLGFQHSSPAIAAAFTNAVTNALLQRSLELFDRSSSASFFDRQAAKYDQEFRRASIALQNFVKTNDVFSVEEQRRLLLRRASNLATTLFETRAALAQKTGESSALASNLRRLRPVASSEYVTTIVDALSPVASERRASLTGARPPVLDPPILMVKVYQDSMVNLFKLNADIVGLRDLEIEQNSQLLKIKDDLHKLSLNEADYESLKRAVDQASLAAETYAKRAVEESVNANMTSAKLSVLKVVQYASEPPLSIFPGRLVALFVGGLGGLIAAVAATQVAERRLWPGSGGALSRQGAELRPAYETPRRGEGRSPTN